MKHEIASPTPTHEPTPSPTPIPEPTPSPTPTHDPTPSPTPKATLAPTVEPLLPIDFSPGMKPKAEGFSADGLFYSDSTISVQIETGRYLNSDFWVATIKIADASQLRTAARDNFDIAREIKGTQLAQRQNAVLAINGDYYSYTGSGYVVRQGKLILDILNGDRDVLLIDQEGDFHGIPMASPGDINEEQYGNRRIMQSFYFGPLLVIDGEVNVNMSLRTDMAANENRQRMAIAQCGHLTYKCICCGPPARGSAGLTLRDFADLVAMQDVYIAYNLDGGDSTMMIFNGEKINDVRSRSTRNIVDLIYFASAEKEKLKILGRI